MKRLVLFLTIMGLAVNSWAAAPSRTFTYTSGEVINPTQVTTNEDNIYTYLQTGVSVLANNSVTSAKITDGAVTNADVNASAAITYSKLSLANSILGSDISTTAALTVSGISVSGSIADKDGDTGTTGQYLGNSSGLTNWETVSTSLSSGASVWGPNDGAQNIDTGTWTKVELDTEVYDINNEFTSQAFTAKTTGYYLASGQVYYGTVTDGKNYSAGIYKNGAIIAHGTNGATSGTGTITPSATIVVYLTVGQYIELYGYQDTGGSVNLGGGNAQNTFLTVTKLGA